MTGRPARLRAARLSRILAQPPPQVSQVINQLRTMTKTALVILAGVTSTHAWVAPHLALPRAFTRAPITAPLTPHRLARVRASGDDGSRDVKFDQRGMDVLQAKMLLNQKVFVCWPTKDDAEYAAFVTHAYADGTVGCLYKIDESFEQGVSPSPRAQPSRIARRRGLPGGRPVSARR